LQSAPLETKRHHSIWQPVFGSVVGIMFASAVLTQPSVMIWSEIWQTATQVLAVHGLYRLLVIGVGAVVGQQQQQQQQYYYASSMKQAAMLVLQLVYTSFFQIPSLLQTPHASQPVPIAGHPRRLVSEFMQNSFFGAKISTGSSTASATAAAAIAAAVFVARTLRRMVVAEVWGRFWKGTWMNQVLNSIHYNTNTLFFSSSSSSSSSNDDDNNDDDDNDESNKALSVSTELQDGSAGQIQHEMRCDDNDGGWLHQVQDFLRDAIRRGSGKLMQRLVQKHVMQVTSDWVLDVVLPLLH
jgi:hypothetical protein